MAEGNRFSFPISPVPRSIFRLIWIPIPSEYTSKDGRIWTVHQAWVSFEDEKECYYVYRQQMGTIIQTGLVVCAGVDDYQSGVIKNTRFATSRQGRRPG